MVFGGVFALTGLWLMLKPKPEGSSAKVELFGLKFESSSAGLLVFIVGALFLALPVMVPEQRGAPPGPDAVPQRASADAGAGTVQGDGDIPLPRRADTAEVEPNDTISDSNQIEVGQTIKGSLAPNDDDWLVFQPEGDAEKFRLTFRNLADGCPQFQLFDMLENQIGGEQVCQSERSATKEFWAESEHYYLRVLANGYRTTYEVVISIP
jgi:hypothetical protein